jgi:hypothetical protein
MCGTWAGPLRSTGITPLPRYDGPLRLPPASGRLPGLSGYTAALLPPLTWRGGEGLSSCCAHPRPRAAATTPPERPGAFASSRRSVLPSPPHRRLGLRNSAVSRPLVRSLSLRPGDSPPSSRGPCRWASGHRSPSSLPSKLRSFWLLLRRDFSPLNAPAFSGRTNAASSLFSLSRADPAPALQVQARCTMRE